MDKTQVGRRWPLEGFGVIEPERFAGLRINGRDLAEGGAGEKNASHHHRRRFKKPRPDIRVAFEDFTVCRTPSPGNLEVCDSRFVDLV